MLDESILESERAPSLILYAMPMKGLRRNDDPIKNKCWYQKKIIKGT
jgi:hypothetical protein